MFAAVFVFGLKWTWNSGERVAPHGKSGSRLLFSLPYFLISVPPLLSLSLSSPESSLFSPPQWPEGEKQGIGTLNIDITLGLTVLTCELFTL